MSMLAIQIVCPSVMHEWVKSKEVVVVVEEDEYGGDILLIRTETSESTAAP